MEPHATSIEIPSRRYGKYQVRSRLGVGGMAEVFLADVVNELGEEQQVALKIMREGQNHEAFVNEADLHAHPRRLANCFTPASWERLLTLRAQWDPDGLFHDPPGI